MVIVLLGILSYGATGLFASRSSYSEYIAKEQLVSQGLLAQQIAFGMSATTDPVSLVLSRNASGKTSFSLNKTGQSALVEELDSNLNSPLIDGAALANGASVSFTWNSRAEMADNANHTVVFAGDKTFQVCFSASGYVYAYESGDPCL